MIPAFVFYGIVPCVAIRSSAVIMASFGFSFNITSKYLLSSNQCGIFLHTLNSWIQLLNKKKFAIYFLRAMLHILSSTKFLLVNWLNNSINKKISMNIFAACNTTVIKDFLTKL